jgi:hypothetical protein
MKWTDRQIYDPNIAGVINISELSFEFVQLRGAYLEIGIHDALIFERKHGA